MIFSSIEIRSIKTILNSIPNNISSLQIKVKELFSKALQVCLGESKEEKCDS